MAKNIEDLIAPNAIPYQGVAFNPLEYKPFTPDVNILQRSLAQIEERNEKASTHKAALKKALGEARLKVNQDEDSLRFFDEFAQQLEEPILAASERGDAAAAIEAAQQSAGDLTNNPAYLGLIQNTARYQESVKTQKTRLDRGEISNEAYERWVDENKFNANWIKDDNGKIIGSSEWNPNYSPVNKTDIYGIFSKIANGLSVRKEAHAPGETEVDSEGNVTSHTTRSGELQALDRPKVIRDFEGAINHNGAYRAAILQEYNDSLYYYEKHKNDDDPKIKANCDLIYDNYIKNNISAKEYMHNICVEYSDDFSYLWDLRSSDTTKPKSGGNNKEKTKPTQQRTRAASGNRTANGGNNGNGVNGKRKRN